jgi:prepilin-type N-terminal cleavage/methylation domain-containing protein
MKWTISQSHKGFTLMEVMVAVSIFAIVVTVGIGALLTINDTYRKSQTERQAIDSLTYVLESMSRSIRTAQEWYPTSTVDTFKFKDQDGIDLWYIFQYPKIILRVETAGGTLIPGDYDLTPMNVEIGNLAFTAALPPTALQSYLQINIQGKVTNAKQVSDFAFQTGVSKRVLDVQ